MGEQCTWYDSETGKPQKLRQSSKSAVCERCLRAGLADKNPSSTAANDDSPDYRQIYKQRRSEEFRKTLGVEDLKLLDSTAETALGRLLDELVLQLVLECGDFWGAISDLRARWGITPEVALPPTDMDDFDPFVPPPNATEEMSDQELYELIGRWSTDVRSIEARFVPERFRSSGQLRRAIANFALFQPPRDNLFGFVASCGAHITLSGPQEQADIGSGNLVVMPEAPIEVLRDAKRVEGAWKHYYEGLIHELGERHLKPLGLDIGELIDDVLRNAPNLDEMLLQNLQEISRDQRQYIKVDEFTTKDDVVNAYRIIAQHMDARPQHGRPARNSLTCVQYAIWCEEYGWTPRQIAQRIEKRTDQQMVRRVGEWAEEGCKILRKS